MSDIVEYNTTEAALQTLRGKYHMAIYDVTTLMGMSDARKARAEIKACRVALEKQRVELKAPALKRSRDIDNEAKRITAELEALETPIDQLIRKEEQRLEQIRLKAIEDERLRVEGVNFMIARYHSAKQHAPTSSAGIKTLIAKVQATSITSEHFYEFVPQGESAKTQALNDLEALLVLAINKEEEERRIAAERAELERQTRELEERRKAEEERIRLVREEEDRRTAEAIRVEEERIAEARRVEEKRIADARAEEDRLRRIREEEDAERRRKIQEEEEKIRLAAIEQERLAREQETAEIRRRMEEDIKRENERLEAQAKLDEERRVLLEEQRIQREKELELQKIEEEQQARTKLQAERRLLLKTAKRETPEAALADILTLAEDLIGRPDHSVVRAQIAIIAEATLQP